MRDERFERFMQRVDIQYTLGVALRSGLRTVTEVEQIMELAFHGGMAAGAEEVGEKWRRSLR